MNTYRPRIVDQLLKTYLEASPAVQLAGARASGKTTTGMQAASSVVRIDRMGNEASELVSLNPSAVLEGELPRLLDE